MRTTIKADDQGYVTISYDDTWTDSRVTRTFFCPAERGYVRECDSAAQHPQVCERLSSQGDTLVASRPTLLTVIRAEYQAMRRREKREALAC